MNEQNRVIGIDLFAGAGGLSLGAKMAGISVKVAVEQDRYAVETYRANHPDTLMINSDIRNLPKIVLPEHNGPVILFGGPPCQGFSTSNRRTNTKINPANWLYREFVRFTRSLNPDWIVVENVKGLLELDSGFFFAD